MKFTFTLLPLMGALTLAFANTAHAQEQTVVIGLTGRLSGSNAFAGKDNENGVRLAIDDLNAKKITVGGKTLKFVLQSEDDQCDPKAGVQVAQKFVDDGVKFVMGPYCSGVAVPASRIYNEGGAMMSTVGTNPKVTLGGYKNLFRIIASDNQIGTGMASYAAKVLKVKSVAVIDDRTAFGQGVAQEFTKEAKRLGLNVVGQEFTTDKATDFTSILTTLKAKNPDAIFFGGYAPQAAPMTRQMKQLAVKAKLLGGDTLCSPEMGKLAGDAVNDVVFCAQGGSMLDKTTAGPAFKAKYKQRYNQDADVYAAPFYDQAMFIGESIQKAGSLDPDKVGAVMYQASYKGIMGTYAYDDKGNLKQAPITVYTFKNAALVPLASY
jgi:ABC-type branched-subunit amino acid transport system substrate-binding protein